MPDTIVNRVAKSPIITFDLGEYYAEGKRVIIDIKDQLFQGMILREKDFREYVKTQDWAAYQDQYVALYCSVDAIVPVWAYMLLATKLSPYAKHVAFGDLEALETELYQKALASVNPEDFRDRPVVVKGCGDKDVPNAAYVMASQLLQPVAKTIMYGEPCSTVPLYKKPKASK